LGALLWAGHTAQVLGLDRTTEAVSAFLTSLTVVFVPLLMAIVVRRPPRATLWLPVGLAALGIWLMTGAAPSALGEVARWDSPWQMATGQFLTVGMASAVTCLFVSRGPVPLTLSRQWAILFGSELWLYVALLTVVSTMTAFGLMFYFQPKLDPTRAALIYLGEPIFAALYAYLAVGRTLSVMALLGAGLILSANVLVEVLERRARPASVTVTRAG
jgi:drug/metabolite transporter (DMT)-like permease